MLAPSTQKTSLLALTLVLVAGGTVAASAPPQWDATLGTPGLSGVILASAMFDDGSGPALFVGGNFTTINGTLAWSIAKTYDGQRWYPLAGGLRNGTVNAGSVETMKVVDLDGAGPNPPVLVVGGTFTNARNDPNVSVSATNIAIWNGTSWSAMGLGLGGTADGTRGVQTLEIFDSGSGPQLYAGGDFTSGGTGDIAVWTGSSWSSVGFTGAVGGWIRNLLVFDDGSGPALYAGGNFSSLGAPNTTHIARWNGSAWSSVGGGVSLRFDRLIAFDADGAGPDPAKLHTIRGGALNTWDGTAWSGEVTIPGTNGLMVNTGAVVFDEGSGPRLFIGATDVNGIPRGMIRFDGSTFTEVGDLVHRSGSNALRMSHLGVHTIGGTPTLFLGGLFNGTDAVPNRNILRWSNGNWAPLTHFGGAAQPAVLTSNLSIDSVRIDDLLPFDFDGAGPQESAMIVTGEFGVMGGTPLNGLAVRSGQGWVPLAGGVPNAIRHSRLFSRHGASGDELFVVAHGDISTPTNLIVGAGVYQLVNGAWTSLGSSFGFRGAFFDPVFDTAVIAGLASIDFGSGNRLFAFGRIGDVDGVVMNNITMWDGNTWSPVGAGLLGASVSNAPNSGEAFDDGSGPALFVAGTFTDRVSKWNGSTWTPVATGLPASGAPILTLFNGELWAFMSAPRQLYRWNGTLGEWQLQSTAPASIDSTTISLISLIGVANPGTGDRLYFGTGAPANTIMGRGILEFDGTTWTSDPTKGRTNTGSPTVVSHVVSGGEDSLWFGGAFSGVGGQALGSGVTLSAIPSGGIARWYSQVPQPTCPADLDDGTGTGTTDGGIDINDLLYFLAGFESGSVAVDLDNGTGTGTPDGGVDINDLLFFLVHFEAGC